MNDAIAPEALREALPVVLFSVGGWRMGVEARLVRGLRPATEIAPETAPEGALAAALGLAQVSGSLSGAHCLTLKRAEQDKEIRVDAPVDLLNLPIAAIYPLPPLLAARTRLRGLRALAIRPEAGEKALTLLFDADTF